MPKKDGYDNWMNFGGNVFDYVDSGKKGSSSDFFSYIDTGENYGDYTERPKGKSRRGRPKISNNPNEFGISLQALGDVSGMSIENSYGLIKQGRKARRERVATFKQERDEKIIREGRKEGKVLKRGQHLESLYDRTKKIVKHKIAQRHTANTLKKYYHPKEKKPEREVRHERPQRFRHQRDMR